MDNRFRAMGIVAVFVTAILGLVLLVSHLDDDGLEVLPPDTTATTSPPVGTVPGSRLLLGVAWEQLAEVDTRLRSGILAVEERNTLEDQRRVLSFRICMLLLDNEPDVVEPETQSDMYAFADIECAYPVAPDGS